ncbi:MAG: DEAD/DEAH box helicase [Luteolibacter sp.]|uniref:DEAD/DEAH box helicase n=1 Tax=Luteolibacter sp. TaxID=1962973 RepID=UPI0032635C7C
MAVDLQRISGFPGLREWIAADHWQGRFDRFTLLKSRPYVTEAAIGNVGIHHGDARGAAVVFGLVQGNSLAPYRTQVSFTPIKSGWKMDSVCSCPVGLSCKHAAALLALASSQLGDEPSGAITLIGPELHEWLKQIETATKAVTVSVSKPLAKSDSRFLAYCIEKPRYRHGASYDFVMRVGTRQKDGSIQISESRAGADPSKPPKYMVREDMFITALYHQRYRSLHLWNDMPFAGSGWEEILDEIFPTGRFYFTDGAFHPSGYRSITPGPVQTVNATWEMSADGSARPVLRCADPGFIILPTQPPRYLDPATGQMGVLESALPDHVLSAWLSGPPVSAKELEVVSKRFSTITTAALPVPLKIESETRATSDPQPHLRVHSRLLGKITDLRSHIVGQISFRYLDSPLLTPLRKGATQNHVAMVDGKRVVWPRNFKAEHQLASRFMKAGFVALSEIIPAALLDTAGLYSCVPAKPLPSPQLAWIDLLKSPEMDDLRAAGWTIEVDPKAGLTAYDAADFFPEIEADPDHGIDWFRFDIACELNGSRVSLIPVIAAAIRMDLPPADAPDLPEFITLPCENPEDGFIRFPARRLIEMVDQVRHLFHGVYGDGPIRIDRLAAAGVADTLAIDSSATNRALAELGRSLKNITSLPPAEIPASVRAELRPYQAEGFRWLRFLADHGLHGILADDMGLGKTIQTLVHLAAERERNPGRPSLVIAPTSVVPNWAAEAEKFTPHLKVLTLQGKDRADDFSQIAHADIVLTSYPLLARDFDQLLAQDWHVVVLDEAQYIKNPKAVSAQNACRLKSAHRVCLSGTPMENHLGELWSLMRFLMPGFLSDEKTFNTHLRRPIERDRSSDAQIALNRRVAPLILRRTKDQVATELPEKTEIIHGIDLTKEQADLYETVRAAMDKRVRDAIAAKGLGQSHIIVLDALLKLRQICCHPLLLKSAAGKVDHSAKLEYLTSELLPTLLEEGRRILLFSTFTSMLALIEEHLIAEKIPYLKLTGQTQDRATLVAKFQTGEIPIFLISLKAGGTGLNLTAADTVIHYDPWWNPAAENQATDRAHRIGQTKPVFVHKLVCRGTIEDRILELQKHKAALVEALLSDETSKLRIDAETLSHLLSPLD